VAIRVSFWGRTMEESMIYPMGYQGGSNHRENCEKYFYHVFFFSNFEIRSIHCLICVILFLDKLMTGPICRARL
jgi:hypothetical protein